MITPTQIAKREFRYVFRISLFLFGIVLMAVAPVDYKLFGLIYVALSIN